MRVSKFLGQRNIPTTMRYIDVGTYMNTETLAMQDSPNQVRHAMIRTKMEKRADRQEILWLRKENTLLQQENRRLKSLLTTHGIPWTEKPKESPAERNDLARIRIELYKSFFRGRQDVYAQRYISKNGKKGYYPVVKSQYRQWNHARNRFETIDAPDESIYEPLTDQVLYCHLTRNADKNLSIGLYVVVNEDECFLSVIDFDGDHWQDDLKHIMNIARNQHLPFLVERSQSGKGAHLWFFFAQALGAKQARQLCSSLITLAMESHPRLRMETYDRIFPTQDSVTKNGLGNLIALPLNGTARSAGNTLFLDEHLEPFEDPWSALERTEKITEDQLESFFSRIGSSFDTGPVGLHAPVKQLQSPVDSLEITYADGLHIAMENLPAALVNRLKRIASFKNPEFYKAERMRLSTWNKPRIICCAYQRDNQIMVLPRGSLDAVKTLCEQSQIRLSIHDARTAGVPVSLAFSGTLREEQNQALETLTRHEIGILSAPTGFGKTVVGAALIAALGRSALIVVPTKPLLEQWHQSLSFFLTDEGKPIVPGILGGGKESLTGRLDIAIINSLAQEQHIKALKSYGVIIVDECHHAGAVTYERVLRTAGAKHVYGFTATPIRNDGHNEIVFMQCGPVVHQVAHTLHDLVGLVIPRFTGFRCDHHTLDIQQIYEKLSSDSERNRLIVTDIETQVERKRSILVLSNRLEQLALLDGLLKERQITALVMTGSQSAIVKRQVASYLQKMRDRDIPALILSTGKYIGEGFDFPQLDTLILAAPIAWKGNVIQYTGRISRFHETKREAIVFDYVDYKIPLFVRMFGKRVNAYKKIGFSISTNEIEPKEKLLYTASDYWEVLEQDLKNTPGPIIFSVPFLTAGRAKNLGSFIGKLATHRVVIMIVRNGNEQAGSDLEKRGVRMVTVDEELSNYILIGSRIVWYGSIQVFGKFGHDDTFLRLDDPTYHADFLQLSSAFLE